ncbi:DoxX family protein [Rufibacter psychrotolerans]|uniref:DoxX family protein n=1 Tax=Rufibacter psychrotolerans TaxID=2812556 RepID=UPI001F087DD7|nr:DoxX family protein [Rufibacter sp. SYSU D00308]
MYPPATPVKPDNPAMSLSAKLDQLHLQARSNKWLYLFAVFCRAGLALGFFPSGLVKILGERFTALSVNHPMGNYLEAVYHTGYYYTMIGVMQVTAAVLLLIPRTAVLGAVLYFPIILNICVLSLSVRFEGSLITSPLMVLANLYLLCWYYPAWKGILPFRQSAGPQRFPGWKELNSQFPVKFFAGVVTTLALVVGFLTTGFELMPRNTRKDCRAQCKDTSNPAACLTFCDCIHQEGQPLNKCLDAYEKAK